MKQQFSSCINNTYVYVDMWVCIYIRIYIYIFNEPNMNKFEGHVLTIAQSKPSATSFQAYTQQRIDF